MLGEVQGGLPGRVCSANDVDGFSMQRLDLRGSCAVKTPDPLYASRA